MSRLFDLPVGEIVKGQMLSSGQKYGLKRNVKTTNSVTGRSTNISDCHNGVDIVSRTGDKNLLALADGKVLYITNDDGTGSKTLVTAHGGLLPNGHVLLVLYAHCDSFKVKAKNDKVTKGQTIAIMGKTGNASGVHLHCSMYSIPPEVWHTPSGQWYSWDYSTREQYEINPNLVLGLY